VVVTIPLSEQQARGNLFIAYRGQDFKSDHSATALLNTTQIHSDDRYTVNKVTNNGSTHLEVTIAAPVESLRLQLTGTPVTAPITLEPEKVKNFIQAEEAKAKQAAEEAAARAQQEAAKAQAEQARLQEAQLQQELKRTQELGQIQGRLQEMLDGASINAESIDGARVSINRPAGRAESDATGINSVLRGVSNDFPEVTADGDRLIFNAGAITNYGAERFFTALRDNLGAVNRILNPLPIPATEPAIAPTPPSSSTPPPATETPPTPSPSSPTLEPLTPAVGTDTVQAGTYNQLDIKSGEIVVLRTVAGVELQRIEKTVDGHFVTIGPESRSGRDIDFVVENEQAFLHVSNFASGDYMIERIRPADSATHSQVLLVTSTPSSTTSGDSLPVPPIPSASDNSSPSASAPVTELMGQLTSTLATLKYNLSITTLGFGLDESYQKEVVKAIQDFPADTASSLKDGYKKICGRELLDDLSAQLRPANYERCVRVLEGFDAARQARVIYDAITGGISNDEAAVLAATENLTREEALKVRARFEEFKPDYGQALHVRLKDELSLSASLAARMNLGYDALAVNQLMECSPGYHREVQAALDALTPKKRADFLESIKKYAPDALLKKEFYYLENEESVATVTLEQMFKLAT
jgi:hypothetical protein